MYRKRFVWLLYTLSYVNYAIGAYNSYSTNDQEREAYTQRSYSSTLIPNGVRLKNRTTKCTSFIFTLKANSVSYKVRSYFLTPPPKEYVSYEPIHILIHTYTFLNKLYVKQSVEKRVDFF